MSRLREILDHKRGEIAKLIPRAEHLRAAALQREDFRSLSSAIERGEGALGLIAEVKKASPSAGAIVEDFDPVGIARAYESAGAHAISVLTDARFFGGDLGHLVAVRGSVSLPVLRKDFILHEAQIWEASVAGADAILLIVAALEQEELARLHAVAETCLLEVLVEAHSLEEVDRAIDCGARIIGVNNRDLATFEVDLATTETLAEHVPHDVLLVSESGIKTAADAQRALAAGANALLVGEALMRSGDVAGKVAELIGSPLVEG